MWVIVCTDLHTAVGLFTSLTQAVELCKEMNKTGPCIWKPVLCQMGNNVEYIGGVEVPDTIEGIEKWKGGGYL